jgi:hypothetical protein
MSPTRSGYKALGLELVEPLEDHPRRPRRPPMVEEKRDEGAGDPIKLFLMEVLVQQRNEMMDHFSQILRRLVRQQQMHLHQATTLEAHPLQGTS